MSSVIKIEHLYKEYRLGVIGQGTLYRDLQSWWAILRGREDPNSLIGSQAKGLVKHHILALQDINLDVEEGKVLGIIGANGAGKSTLLKILSKVTAPTSGTVKFKGRIASLLEVGTGFHSELTGRENIYLNGAINGMSGKEITRKLDEIVEFAGVGQFLDTPVKRYSSGMYVRLGFAVAAHLDPDILIVDEVLAVGDASFQNKAISKMQDVSQGEGRTVLFVSHNLASIENLCQDAILIEKGMISYNGTARETINYYLNKDVGLNLPSSVSINEQLGVRILNSIRLLDENGVEATGFNPGKKVIFELRIDTKGQILKNPRILIDVLNKRYGDICKFITTQMIKEPFTIEGKKTIKCVWNSCLLAPGVYSVHVKISGTLSGKGDEVYRDIIAFKVLHKDPYNTGRELNEKMDTLIFPDGEWLFEDLPESSPLLT